MIDTLNVTHYRKHDIKLSACKTKYDYVVVDEVVADSLGQPLFVGAILAWPGSKGDSMSYGVLREIRLKECKTCAFQGPSVLFDEVKLLCDYASFDWDASSKKRKDVVRSTTLYYHTRTMIVDDEQIRRAAESPYLRDPIRKDFERLLNIAEALRKRLSK